MTLLEKKKRIKNQSLIVSSVDRATEPVKNLIISLVTTSLPLL
jgi:hypothetical protein